MRITIEKKHEGKTVFGLPTGNNINRNSTNSPVEFAVVKVKRKYVDLSLKGSTIVKAYCPESGTTQEEINSGYICNAGYKFFESLEDIERYLDHHKKLDDIKEYFRSFAQVTLSEKDVNTIHGLIYRT
jgi:hypothetical protein